MACGLKRVFRSITSIAHTDMKVSQSARRQSFNQDGVSTSINTHATPHIDLSVIHLPLDNQVFVAIEARQFSDYPVIVRGISWWMDVPS